MLDMDQRKVANLLDGLYAVYAGPGSGKSTTLLHRTANLAPRGKTLVVTFTAEAAKNLRTRCGKLFPTVDTSCFSTLHSLALKFAHENPEAFPFELAENPLAIDGVAARAAFEATRNKINFKAFTTWVSLQKRNRTTPQRAIRLAEETGTKLDYALAWKAYESNLRKLGVLDFDNLITFMVDILETRPDIRSKWQFEYVQLDEAQDCCELDWRLLQLLTERHGNLMCVGDANQGIFGFRGGISEHFLNMENYFPGTKKLYLGNNYRSTKNIVDFVKKAAPQQDLAEHFKAVSGEDGLIPTITAYSTPEREAEEVTARIKLLNPNDCAILGRTNLSLRPFEEALIEREIPYYLLGDSGFWGQQEVQDLLSYIRCVYAPGDNSLLAAIRSPFHPSRGFKKKIVAEEAKTRAAKEGITIWAALLRDPKTSDFLGFIRRTFAYKNLPAEEVVKRVIKDLKAVEHYKEEEGITPDRNPVQSLQELVRVAGKHGNLEEFLTFVRKVQGASRNRKGVALSTIHASKGKEFPHVFMVQCTEGILPHSKAEDLMEEKNIFFVGVSRAELTLNISYNGEKSRFLI